ncbi:glycoside hydrolase family 10 protein [Algoriphagus sanaruensis]|uniref:Glycoside hydrolase n=1 Tax=Algoriphagus sanaruensis TaxID=1727163 RepID=A0A142EI10_9BACT|nr:family 10 glycosylhydrolase [Algoriphagus sanaruensis]AMQ54765.1 glycoside hydrolase [Algoriphagus sanaruensis]
MNSIPRLFCLFLISILLFGACKSKKPVVTTSKRPSTSTSTIPPKTSETLPTKTLPAVTLKPLSYQMPDIPREFRGVWIATVANIDWPVSPDSPWEVQKGEFLKLLDYYKNLNFNAVIVQIRTAGDAFYPSNYAPWSKYLTGKQGKAPASQENPLTWMIKEAHNRGLEFHAWLNPYRATMDLKTEELSQDHDFFKHREWMLKYGTKWYYDPGLPEVKNHLLAIIKEVVTNYDIDAIHFDDYFYPYKEPKQDFPDQKSFQKYRKSGQSIDDWRRQNVNELIQALHFTIKDLKPWVQFGISPFGVWRNQNKDPKGSPTQAGQTNYDDLYADVLLWMKNKWIDYLIPQLYWSMEHRLASHRKLADWWSNNNFGIPVYIGNGPYKIREDSDEAWKNPSELNSQVNYARTLPQIHGNAFFSAKSIFIKNQDIAQRLKNEVYDRPTLPPSFEPKTPAIIEIPVVLDVKTLAEKTQINLEKPLDPAIRYAMVQGGNDLNSLHEAIIHTAWVGGARVRYLEVPSLNTEYLAIRWIDHYGRIVQTQVFQTPKSTRP